MHIEDRCFKLSIYKGLQKEVKIATKRGAGKIRRRSQARSLRNIPDDHSHEGAGEIIFPSQSHASSREDLPLRMQLMSNRLKLTSSWR